MIALCTVNRVFEFCYSLIYFVFLFLNRTNSFGKIKIHIIESIFVLIIISIIIIITSLNSNVTFG